jgi:DNA-binding PadR family transcriptional regulator
MNDNQEIKVQNLTKLYTLVLLKSKESVTGYYVLKKLREELDKTASPTYVYDFLKNLKSRGYVDSVQSSTSKRGSGYRLTPTGSEFVSRIFERFDNLIEVAIQSKIKACASCGAKLYDDYHFETIDGREMIFCCIHCAKAFKTSYHKSNQ